MTVRLLTGGRIVLGTILLLAPESVLVRLSQRPVRMTERAVARLLGARHLVEGAIVARHPSPVWLLTGAAVDATHSLSMVALAAVKPEQRRLATASAAAAAAAATVGIAAAFHASTSAPGKH